MNKQLYKLKQFIPISVRRMLLQNLNFATYREYSNRMANPYKDNPDRVIFDNNNALMGTIYSKHNRPLAKVINQARN